MIFVVGNPVIHKSIHALICDAIIRECFSQRITLTNLVSLGNLVAVIGPSGNGKVHLQMRWDL